MHTLRRTALLAAVLSTVALANPGALEAQPSTTYRVTVTNLTQHQIFSYPIVATHRADGAIFHAGGSVNEAFWLMAEDGIAADLAAELEADSRILDVAVAPEFLMPGHSVTLTVEARPPFLRLSAVGMLVSTNDAFFGLDGLPLVGPWLQRINVPAYDAGTEANSEDCAFVPGPPCHSAEARDTAGAEGFISIHPGLHGTGDLAPETFNWRNPVAEIRIVRLPG